jgi:hypothetical protein
VFGEFESAKRNRILNLIRNIEIELISSGSVYEFLNKNEEFLEGFHHVLGKMLETSEHESTYHENVEAIRKRFNIDCGLTEVGGSMAQCWVLGMQRKFYLIEESDCFLVVSPSTSTESTKSMNESAIENKMES